MSMTEQWLKEHGVVDVECLMPDMNGVLRGKVVPSAGFLRATQERSLRLASSLLTVTTTGEYSGSGDARDQDIDLLIVPDLQTGRLSTLHRVPTAMVNVECFGPDGQPWPTCSRGLLRRVLALYEQKGWSPVVAPELEFYVAGINPDTNLPLSPPVGRSSRTERVAEPYGLEALFEYAPFIGAIYEAAATTSLDLGSLIHESGTAQLEINLTHGNALDLADQAIVFKRLVRQVALAHDMYATFMAKPMADQPGSAMHIHVSIVDAAGDNIFVEGNGDDTALFRSFVAGLQRYLPVLAPLYAPSVNSFRRLRPKHSAPINLAWGTDNRSCGLRVPAGSAGSRRVENRLPGADANPYLAMAATLIAGWLGIEQALEPSARLDDSSAYRQPRTLPTSLEEAIARMRSDERVAELLGVQFLEAFCAIKETELDDFHSVVTPWEREHLTLKA